MASISVTNTFTNGTTADASQVNQNFTDIINGTSDGTKDFSINALTCAGTATLNGNVNLGNAAGDDLTITASLASTLAIKTTALYNIGSTTIGLAGLFLGVSTFTTKLATAATASWTFTFPTTAGTSDYVLKTDGSGNTSWRAWTTPTMQTITSGTGTYTTPANVKWIRVRMVGGGGGSSGSGTAGGTAAGDGGTSYFRVGASPDLLVASGGGKGVFGTNANAPGGASLGTGPIGTFLTGSYGQGGGGGGGNASSGGCGGSSAIFGGGSGGGWGIGAAVPGTANTGGGAGGPGGNNVATSVSGTGGSGAGSVDAIIIPTALQQFAYSVGAGGTAGGAGTAGLAGAAGGTGYIEVTEFYQ